MTYDDTLHAALMVVTGEQMADELGVAQLFVDAGWRPQEPMHLDDEKIKLLASVAKVSSGVAQNWLWLLDGGDES